MSIDLAPLWLSFQLATVTTLVLFVLSLPLACWLAYRKNWLTSLLEVVVALPLVLPPTVLGFYILIAFSPQYFPGSWLKETIGLEIAFSFSGLVLGSLIYSLPFMVQPLQAGLESFPPTLVEASYTLGKSKMATLFQVILPNCKGSVATAMILTFAHTLGEFGVVLMIGGNIPHRTRVTSIAIYDEVQALHYREANFYALVLLGASFSILLLLSYLNRQKGISLE